MSSCRIKKWQQFGRETISGSCGAEKPADAKKSATDAQLAALLKVRAEQDALYCGGTAASTQVASTGTEATTYTSSGR